MKNPQLCNSQLAPAKKKLMTLHFFKLGEAGAKISLNPIRYLDKLTF